MTIQEARDELRELGNLQVYMRRVKKLGMNCGQSLQQSKLKITKVTVCTRHSNRKVMLRTLLTN